MKNKIITSLLTLVAAGSLQAAPTASTEKVWQHHIDAWVARDLEAIASDYDESSIMIVNNVVYRGREEIKPVFARLFRTFDRGDNKIDPAFVEGRIVYITWHFTPQGGSEFYGTDTFLIENGIIKVQTIASPLYDSASFLP